MAVQLVFVKTLTQTDITKRLSVPTKKKICFLDFGGQHNVGFKAMDSKGKVWPFSCSKRKAKGYPKPVLSKGWLPFVRCWELEIGDKVILYRQTMDRAGMGDYLIDVIRKEPLPLTLIQNHDTDKVMAIASYMDDEGETTITSDFTDVAMTNIEEVTSGSTDQVITYDQTEGLQNQHGFMFEFISLKPDIAVRERKSIDFFELGSQEQTRMKFQLPVRPLLTLSSFDGFRTHLLVPSEYLS
ncbi:hypothetical protein GQ457_17G001610 [Hibiscus cannabinus]